MSPGTSQNYNLSRELKARRFMFRAKCSYQYKLKGKARGVIVLRISSITGLRQPSSEGNKYTGNVELQRTHSITRDRSLINTPSLTQKNYAIYSNALQRRVSPIQKQSAGGPDILQPPRRHLGSQRFRVKAAANHTRLRPRVGKATQI